MSERTGIAIQLQAADGQSYIGHADDDDPEQLRQLFAAGPRSVALDQSSDTEGHASSAELILDVEGHAVALRLPTPADAAAVRRAFALGIVSASIVIGGVGAAAVATGALTPADQPAVQAPVGPVIDAPNRSTDTNPLHLPRPIERD